MSKPPSASKAKNTTMKEVAALADVSLMTVSRVLNKDPKVTEETRNRVMAAVEKLNYRVNVSARSLSGTQSYLMGFFYDNSVGSFISEYLIGTLKRCNELGYQLVIEQCPYQEANLEEHIKHLASRYDLDGIIIPPPLCDDLPLLNALDKAGLRYVRVGPGLELDRSSYVTIDDYRATFEMTELLIQRGHKHIGFIKGDAHQGVSEVRFKGYCDAIKKHRLELNENFITEGNFSFASGMIAAEKLLQHSELTAIFASNDDMAAAVVAVAHRKHIEIPQQLAVVGFDDTNIATTIWPQLTTVQQPIKNMAIAAVDLLIEKIKAETLLDIKVKNNRTLDYTIIERESV
ncbi:MAG: LacI family DNA-binding transcriptional regulator [Cellvibrio sp.]|uniref:LacI family DNA-binding transcriptional regulator n=1 Tax=Cellvibrio sp. TaxID=1965322 RepID=UPI0031A7937E